MKTYFKRNKANDSDITKAYFNGKAYIGYDLIECYTDDDEKKAKKQGYCRSLRGVESVRKTRKRSDNQATLEIYTAGNDEIPSA